MTDDRRPTPGANAARRARRIGGRPTPAPSAASTDTDTSVRLEKTAVRVDTVEPRAESPAAQPPRDRTKAVRSLPLAWFPAAVLGTAAVLLLGLLVWFGHGGYWGKPATKSQAAPSSQQQEQVVAAAKQCFATLNTYDYRKLDEALAAGVKCTTGKFTTDYQAAFRESIEKYAPAVHAIQTAQVNKAGIASISPDGKQWVVLIFGQLQTDNLSTQKDGSPRLSPVGGVLTMDDVGGNWLVARVDTDAGNGLGG